MKIWMMLIGVLTLAPLAQAQDVGWMLEQAPVVSMVLAKALEKIPSFSARAEVNVSGSADPLPSAASGTIECGAGNLRWDVKIGEIQSAQLSQSARALFKQVNGDRLVLLTSPAQAANRLILAGARAYLEQPLPILRLSTAKAQGNEEISGRVCVKERVTARDSDGKTHEVILWRAKDLKKLPIQVQFTQSGEVIRIRFSDVRFRTIANQRFNVPSGLTKHATIEDLMQWVLVEKMKRRMGL